MSCCFSGCAESKERHQLKPSLSQVQFPSELCFPPPPMGISPSSLVKARCAALTQENECDQAHEVTGLNCDLRTECSHYKIGKKSARESELVRF